MLLDLDTRTETHAYLGGIARKLNCPAMVVGGVEDHVHMLASLARTLSVADFVREVKSGSSI